MIAFAIFFKSWFCKSYLIMPFVGDRIPLIMGGGELENLYKVEMYTEFWKKDEI